ncbi:MAG: methionyl-tRNA formyltransferase [Magnetococcales bacterium]|nr:methionyl-tRNA formyltransferase [Magnetococcales bacterium]MBF0438077.1 methionyl-tRNA formyltransferase [Magnetococcales bacterium]
MKPWRIVFMGTPTFAVPILQALLQGSDPVVGIFTQPDKPTGRGMTVQPTPIKQAGADCGIPIFQPQRLRDPATIADFAALQPDLAVVAAYGQILPEDFLTIPKRGCINVHASLLPRWRGAAPIHRALLAGDVDSGVTIMQMDAGLDTGPILAMERLTLAPTMTGGRLHDALAQLGAQLLMKTIAGLKAGTIQPTPQPKEGVAMAAKLTREDEKIHFHDKAGRVQRHILALNPWPGAVATLGEKTIKILRCRVTSGTGSSPGVIIAIHEDGPEIACGEGAVVITEVQVPGKRRMTAAEWMRGHTVTVGTRLQ